MYCPLSFIKMNAIFVYGTTKTLDVKYLLIETGDWNPAVRCQLHTADQPMAPLGRDKERLQPHDIQKTIKVKRPALPFQAEWLQN